MPEKIRQKLLDMGYEFQNKLHEDEDGFHFLTADLLCDCPEEMASIWVFLLNQVDPELHCTLVNEPSVLYGDGKQSIGYGIFHF